MQHIGHVLSSSAYSEIYALSMKYLSSRPNVKRYFVWAFNRKRCWSDSFAEWCASQNDLTDEQMTEQWRYNAKKYRFEDLQSAIKRQNDKSRQAENQQKLMIKGENSEQLPH